MTILINKNYLQTLALKQPAEVQTVESPSNIFLEFGVQVEGVPPLLHPTPAKVAPAGTP